MTTIKINTAVERVSTEATRRAKPDAVLHATMNVGDYHRQGDVYIQCIAAPPRNGLKEIGLRVQVAPGSTQGSRHCISGATIRHLRMYEKSGATPLDGPVLECFKPITIEHPEHGHVTIPAGWYAIAYQRQHAEELRRVLD